MEEFEYKKGNDLEEIYDDNWEKNLLDEKNYADEINNIIDKIEKGYTIKTWNM
jgi:hypothetical protein